MLAADNRVLAICLSIGWLLTECVELLLAFVASSQVDISRLQDKTDLATSLLRRVLVNLAQRPEMARCSWWLSRSACKVLLIRTDARSAQAYRTSWKEIGHILQP